MVSLKALIAAVAAAAAVSGAAIDKRQIQITVPLPVPISYSESTSTFTTFSSLPPGVPNTCKSPHVETKWTTITTKMTGSPPPDVVSRNIKSQQEAAGHDKENKLAARKDIPKITIGPFPVKTSISVSCPKPSYTITRTKLEQQWGAPPQ